MTVNRLMRIYSLCEEPSFLQSDYSCMFVSAASEGAQIPDSTLRRPRLPNAEEVSPCTIRASISGQLSRQNCASFSKAFL
jgi:hypothetical protein